MAGRSTRDNDAGANWSTGYVAQRLFKNDFITHSALPWLNKRRHGRDGDSSGWRRRCSGRYPCTSSGFRHGRDARSQSDQHAKCITETYAIALAASRALAFADTPPDHTRWPEFCNFSRAIEYRPKSGQLTLESDVHSHEGEAFTKGVVQLHIYDLGLYVIYVCK